MMGEEVDLMAADAVDALTAAAVGSKAVVEASPRVRNLCVMLILSRRHREEHTSTHRADSRLRLLEGEKTIATLRGSAGGTLLILLPGEVGAHPVHHLGVGGTGVIPEALFVVALVTEATLAVAVLSDVEAARAATRELHPE